MLVSCNLRELVLNIYVVVVVVVVVVAIVVVVVVNAQAVGGIPIVF
jgi:hypothetical protein